MFDQKTFWANFMLMISERFRAYLFKSKENRQRRKKRIIALIREILIKKEILPLRKEILPLRKKIFYCQREDFLLEKKSIQRRLLMGYIRRSSRIMLARE